MKIEQIALDAPMFNDGRRAYRASDTCKLTETPNGVLVETIDRGVWRARLATWITIRGVEYVAGSKPKRRSRKSEPAPTRDAAPSDSTPSS